MPIVSIVMGALLVGLSAYGYINGDPNKERVTAFIPADPQLGGAEEVAADDQGNVFAGFTDVKVLQLKKYVK